MDYKKTDWKDTSTPIDAEHLNKIEEGIYEANITADAGAKDIASLNDDVSEISKKVTSNEEAINELNTNLYDYRDAYIRGSSETTIPANATVKISFGETTGALSSNLRSSVLISLCGNTSYGFFDFIINTYGTGSRQHVVVLQKGKDITYTESSSSDGFCGITIVNGSEGALRYGMFCLVGYLPTVEIIEE